MRRFSKEDESSLDNAKCPTETIMALLNRLTRHYATTSITFFIGRGESSKSITGTIRKIYHKGIIEVVSKKTANSDSIAFFSVSDILAIEIEDSCRE